MGTLFTVMSYIGVYGLMSGFAYSLTSRVCKNTRMGDDDITGAAIAAAVLWPVAIPFTLSIAISNRKQLLPKARVVKK